MKKNIIENNNIFKYCLGVTVSNFGNALTTFVFPLMVLDLTKSPMQLCIVTAINMLPYAVIGLPVGAIIDKVNIKKTIKLCDLIRFIIYFVLAMSCFYMNQNIIIVNIYIVSLISGICYVFHSISEVTVIPVLCKKNSLTKVNSFIYGSQYATSIIAPIIGGIFYNSKNFGYFILFDSISFLISLIILFSIKKDFNCVKSNFNNFKLKELVNDIKIGFKVLFAEKKMANTLIIIAISNLILASYYNFILVYLSKIYNNDSSKMGLVIGITSIGALIGSIIASKISSKISFFKVIILMMLFDSIFRCILPFTKNMIIIIFCLTILELIQSILNIMVITVRQYSIDKIYLGRVNSVFKTCVLGVIPIGLFIGGILLERLGVILTLKLTSVICILLFIYSFITLRDK